jgi:hypothetical protein
MCQHLDALEGNCWGVVPIIRKSVETDIETKPSPENYEICYTIFFVVPPLNTGYFSSVK